MYTLAYLKRVLITEVMLMLILKEYIRVKLIIFNCILFVIKLMCYTVV